MHLVPHRCTSARVCSLAFVVLWTFCASTAFGQGAARQDRAAVQFTQQPYVPAPRPDTRPAIVDLRDHLPPVGEQTMNDCVAWAYGYAARSYMEAVDQNWKPNHVARVFSPTYIYNQINGGKDDGSSPLRAVELLRDKGIATLETQPYLRKDFKSPVNASAHPEAAVFRIASFSVANDGEMVRDALAAGQIVCIGVRTNPTFSSGRYDIYTPKLHHEGIGLRREGQPHGFHAMVIAGYDDHRRAFLLMNSWGSAWGQRGFVWVSYDVADRFNLRESTEQLIDYAIVMEDRHESVVRANRTYQLFKTDQLSLHSTPSVAGFDDQDHPQYDVAFQLIGPLPELAAIKQVQWHYHDGVEDKTYSVAKYARTILRTTRLEQTVRAEVELRNGRRIDVTVPLKLPAVVPHRIELERIDAFVHAFAKEQPQFRWTLVPRMKATDWAALERIEWRVFAATRADDPNLRPNLMPLSNQTQLAHHVIYQHQQQSEPPTGEPSLAYPSGVNFVVPTGAASFVFRDGQTVVVALPDNPFPTVTGNGFTLSHVERPVGIFAGEEWYFVEIKATIPEAGHRFLRSAEFIAEGLGSDQDRYMGQLTTGLEPLGYVFRTYASRTFNLRARVQLASGQLEGTISLVEMALWQREGRLAVTTPPEQIALTPLAGEVRLRDRYLGLDAAGQPRWRFEPYLIETRPLHNWYEYWNWENWAFDRPTVEVIDQNNRFTGFPEVLVEAGAGVTMTIPAFVVQRVNGEETPREAHDFKIPLTAQTPPTTGLTLRAIKHTPNQLAALELPPVEPLVEVDLRGGLWEMRQIRRVDFLVPRAGGWVQAVRVDVPDVKNVADDLRVAVLPQPAEGAAVRAVATLSNGGTMALEAPVLGWLPYAPPPEVSFTAVSRYWGTEQNRPTWRADLRVDGRLDAIAKIKNVVFTATDEAGARHPVTPSDLRAATVMAEAPLRLHATVTFLDQREPAELDTVMLTPAETILPDGQFTMKLQHLHTKPAVGGRGVANAMEDFEDTRYERAAYLQAPLKDLDRVREVAYRVDGSFMTYEPAIADRAGKDRGDRTLPRDVFAHSFEFIEAEDDTPVVHGVVVLKNGTKRPEQTQPSPLWTPAPEPTVQVETQPWSGAAHTFTAVLLTKEAIDADRAHLSATYQWTAGSADTPAETAIAYGWPHSPLPVQLAGPVVLQQVRLSHLENEHAEEQTLELPPRTIAAPTYRPDQLRVETTPQGYRVIPDFNGHYFQDVTQLWYEVQIGNETQRIEPIAWIGPGHERFAVDRRGAKPDRVVMKIKTADGKISARETWSPPSDGSNGKPPGQKVSVSSL